MNILRAPFRFPFAVAVLALATGVGCGDPASPKSAELSGEYVLARVGDRTLPILRMTYGDGSWDELDRASLRFLSRERLVAARTLVYRYADGSFRAEATDSLVFSHVRSADRIHVTVRDSRGVHHDTLAIVQFAADTGLRVLSSNYVLAGMPAPLIPNGLYIRHANPAAGRRAGLLSYR